MWLARKGDGNEAFNAGARWRQSESMSDNKRNKNLHSTPFVYKAHLKYMIEH